MKYLSHKNSSSTQYFNIKPDGNTTSTIELDFSYLQSLDSKGESRYIVGGRTYFEASVFGNDIQSFTFRGFFDQEGYEEPKSLANKLKSSGWLYVIIALCIALVIVAIVLVFYCKNKKEEASKKANKDKLA